MKYWLIILLIGIVFIGCDNSLEITNENIMGNWYSCVEEDGYTEHHITNEYVEYCSEAFIELDVLDAYYFSNDTIFFYSGEKKDYNNFYIIKSISKNKIVVKTMTRDLILFRIPDSIEVRKWGNDFEEQSLTKEEFIKKFWNRKEKYGCQFNYVHKGEEGVLEVEEE